MATSFRFKYKNKRKTRFRKQPLAVKAYKLAKKAYKMPELKYKPDGLTSTVLSTGSLIAIDDMAQGTTNNQRIGDTIHPTSVKFRFNMSKNAAATSSQIRILVFRWISGNPAAVLDVLEAANVQSFKSEDNRFKSEILYDKVFRVDTDNPKYFRTAKVKLNKPISYAGGTTSSNRNGIWIIFLGDEAVNTPTLDWQSRLFYKDA